MIRRTSSRSFLQELLYQQFWCPQLTFHGDCRDKHCVIAITFPAWINKIKCTKRRSVPKLKEGVKKRKEKKAGILNTTTSRWSESYMQRGELWNGEGKIYPWLCEACEINHITLQCYSGSKAHPKKELNEINITLRWRCIPLVMSETSIWEHPSIRGSTAEARGLGASVARLQLMAEGMLCVGAEVVWSIGPSEMLLPLPPSWPVGGASKTTDEQ